MLLDKKDVFDILRCPSSGKKLKRIDDKLIPDNGEDVTQYDIIDDLPVLIDFDQGILEREDTGTKGSLVERRSYRDLSGWAKRLVSPPNRVTAANVSTVMDLMLESKSGARVLIIGGGTVGQGMKPFYDDPRIALVSFDIYRSPTVQFLADAHRIPLPDDFFDAVIIQAVLEHVLDPVTVVSEIHRVLKPEGLVYAETPFLQHIHEGAYDFTRFTESGHRYLFNKFALIRSGATTGAGTQLLWSLDYFFRGLFRSRNFGKLVKLCFFWLQHCDRIIPAPYNIDAASGVFFLGKKQESRIEEKDMVAHYKGAQG
jgi:SAM-dependent methyltransferase